MSTEMKKVDNAPKAVVEFKDVTKERMHYVAKKYMDSIDKILSDGKQYKVVFTEGYTVEGKKEVIVKGIIQICRYSWLATEEYLKKHPELNKKEEKKTQDKKESK